MENHSLREENRRLKSLEPVKRAQEMDAQTIAMLEKAFSEVSGTEQNDKSKKWLLQYMPSMGTGAVLKGFLLPCIGGSSF